jgi:hypothetical protein
LFHYRYEVKPAYTRGLYQRYDKWVLEGRAVPADSMELNDNSSMSYSAGIVNKNEATKLSFRDFEKMFKW